MEDQKEALRRIVGTLANKNEELHYFLETLGHTLSELQENSSRATSDLQMELESLNSALQEARETLTSTIREETQRREEELQKQHSQGQAALLSAEQLLEFANEALNITDKEEFSKAAKQIKERVTMAPAFRLTVKPAVSESMSHLTVDFSREREMLHRLGFLSVPRAPEIDPSDCLVCDSVVMVSWRMPNDAGEGGGATCKVDHYTLEYRKTNHDGAARIKDEHPWETVDNLRTTEHTLTGLKFNTGFLNVRVRACNKAAAGDYSDPVTLETRAFNFSLDAATAHLNLRVQGDTVEWNPQGVKGLEPKGKGQDNKGRSTTPSPKRTTGSSRSPATRGGRDRFTGESYTVLGDRAMDSGSHYWEVRPSPGCKSFSVGVAYRAALGKFDQLGKSAGAWCLHASQWLQTSLAAKHNNRAKSLEIAVPEHIGVYCHVDDGELSFYNAESQQLIHTFRTKFTQPVVPAFMVWCGSFTIITCVQVPRFIGTLRKQSENKSTSSLNSLPQ